MRTPLPLCQRPPRLACLQLTYVLHPVPLCHTQRGATLTHVFLPCRPPSPPHASCPISLSPCLSPHPPGCVSSSGVHGHRQHVSLPGAARAARPLPAVRHAAAGVCKAVLGRGQTHWSMRVCVHVSCCSDHSRVGCEVVFEGCCTLVSAPSQLHSWWCPGLQVLLLQINGAKNDGSLKKPLKV